MTLSTGQVLNERYRIVKLLGQGGFGAVYRAWDTRLNVACALKENFANAVDAQRQFEREATLLANLRHPNLPRVTDTFILANLGQYLVMDYIEGEDLQEKLDRQAALSVDDIVSWCEEVCQALDYLHNQKSPIIHRDIKPANIKITPEGHAILVDFGIAKVFDPGSNTTAGARAVTPPYSPYEQYGRGGTDARSDIYALGVTMYILLTRQEPPESIHRLAGDPTPKPSQINPAIPRHIEAVIEKAMELKPEDRFQTAAEVRSAIKNRNVIQTTTPAKHRASASAAHSTPALPEFIIQPVGGDYPDLASAMRSAPAGSRLLVKPGRYSTPLVINKTMEVIGDGALGTVILECRDLPCLTITAPQGVIRGLVLIQLMGSEPCHTVEISAGGIVMEGCDITNMAQGACVAIHGKGTNPQLQSCRIHDSAQSGVFFYDGCRGSLEDCELDNHAMSSVAVSNSEPSLKRCHIHDGHQGGLYFYESAGGLVEDCEIDRHGFPEVTIKQGSNPTLRGCHIHNARQNGVHVLENGHGLLEDCEIAASRYPNVAIKKGGNPTLHNCHIHSSQATNILVVEGGEGKMEGCKIDNGNTGGISVDGEASLALIDCEISHNKGAGVFIVSHGHVLLTRCQLTTNTENGAFLENHGVLTMMDSDVSGNAMCGIMISNCSNLILRGGFIHHNPHGGLYFTGQSEGEIRGSEIAFSPYPLITIEEDSDPLFTGCKIHDSEQNGVHALKNGKGRFVDCDIFSCIYPNIAIKEGADVSFIRCRIHHSQEHGVLALQHSHALLEDCLIENNDGDGVQVSQSASLNTRGCQIMNNHGAGVSASGKGRGLFENNRISANAHGAWAVEPGCTIRQTGTILH